MKLRTCLLSMIFCALAPLGGVTAGNRASETLETGVHPPNIIRIAKLVSDADPEFLRQASALPATHKACAGDGCRQADSIAPPPLRLIQRPRQYVPFVRTR